MGRQMSDLLESLCKLISNILGINYAINQWYMVYLALVLMRARVHACVCV